MRVRTAVMYSLLFSLVTFSLAVLLYDLYRMNFSSILNTVLFRSSNPYHLIVMPVRTIGTVIAFVLFLPFLRLFLINSEVAIAIFLVIEIAVLLVVHIALMYISLVFINKAIKNGNEARGF